ncbi:MAG: transketolase [Lachnospiraceae bacterium]|nr:transketolase [Lachnospiraceae bacterium]
MREKQEELIGFLEEKALEIRKKSLMLITEGHVGHPGASLSEADMLAALYYAVLKIRPDEPAWEDRDRFIMSKGHGCPPLYVVLSMKGYYAWEELVGTYGKLHSRFQAHPDMKKTPGIDMTTGSLGQGLSVAVGMAKAAKDDGKTHRIYCMLGDGECQEGQIWEAAMFAAHYKLDNLCCIVDYNKIQAKGPVHEIMNIEPLSKKWESFGFDVIEADGHSMRSILDAFYEAENLHYFGRPVVIIAHTIKGKGVSFMENTSAWHTHAPNREQLAAALDELSGEVSHKWKK